MVKIVVDGACEVSNEVAQKYDLHCEKVPLTINLDGKEYIEGEDIDSYLEASEKSSSIPKTGAPSPESFLEAFKGEESVFAVTITSKLSGTYNSALLAKQMYLDEIGQKFIHVFDSLSASVGETLIALKINELAKNSMSNNEIAEQVGKFVKDLKTYFILENFNSLVKTGRMNGYIAKIASVLSIKAICCAKEGSIELSDKARGYNRAVQKLVDLMLKEGDNFENRIIGITHVKALDRALMIKEEIMKRVKFKDIIIMEMGHLCTTYANRNGVIVCF